KFRPLFELGPLVVGRPERNTDVDVLLNGHASTLPNARHALGLAASAAGQLLRHGVLDASAELLADFPGGPGAVVTHASHQLPHSLRGERSKRHKTCARSQPGSPRERDTRPPAARVRCNRL